MRVFSSVDELKGAVGERLGSSDWLTVDQKRIDLFADATGDHQWIHIDPDRAKDGPFGTTIAHGFLTLALIPIFTPQVFRVDNVKMGVNYGVNKVRFTAPVPVNGRVRGSYQLTSVQDVAGGVQLASTVTVELEGSDRPACVAETLVRYYL